LFLFSQASFIGNMLEWFVNCDCNGLVMPLKIITWSVFLLLNTFLILPERWPWSASIASTLRVFDNTPGQCSLIHSSQSSINCDVM
jgi:hypothetical protein